MTIINYINTRNLNSDLYASTNCHTLPCTYTNKLEQPFIYAIFAIKRKTAELKPCENLAWLLYVILDSI